MPLTVDQLREILKDQTIDGKLPVVFVAHSGTRNIATSAFGTAVIERDGKSHAPVTGRVSETRPELLQGAPEACFALYES